jgi:hypothetical protein
MTRRFEFGDPVDPEWGKRFVAENDGALTSVTYATARIGATGQLLHSARAGELDENWRDTLEPPQFDARAHQMYRDAYEVAFQDLRELPRAPWEPYVASTWRQALDAWFLASWSNLNALLDIKAETRVSGRSSRLSIVAMAYRQGQQATIDMLLDQQPMMDGTAFLELETEIRDRDMLGAWYRAGLAAGGEPVDWVSWYEACISRWRNQDLAARARAELDDTGYRANLEALPDYWRHPHVS